MNFENFQKKVVNKCEGLLHLVVGVQGFYKTTNADNKRFIETTIGAAIWYLPRSSSFLFTGKISKEALDKGQRSEDHLFPRKIAAQEILKVDWKNKKNAVAIMADTYIKKYGRFNYVSKEENKKLTPFQKSQLFIDATTAYKNAGIELVDFDEGKVGLNQKSPRAR